MDMQRMAQGLTGNDNSGGGDDMSTNNENSEAAQSREPPAAERGGSLSDLLSGFDIDEEKALIALLIYILWKNDADKKLLLGLGYLLL